MAMAERTCIIIPCFNEADRFKREQYLSFLQQVPDIDLCFVNDGSRDDTLRVLQDIRQVLSQRAETMARSAVPQMWQVLWDCIKVQRAMRFKNLSTKEG